MCYRKDKISIMKTKLMNLKLLRTELLLGKQNLERRTVSKQYIQRLLQMMMQMIFHLKQNLPKGKMGQNGQDQKKPCRKRKRR